MPRPRLEEGDDRLVFEERLGERERLLARLGRAARGEPGPGRQRDLRSVRPGRHLGEPPPQGLVVRTSRRPAPTASAAPPRCHRPRDRDRAAATGLDRRRARARRVRAPKLWARRTSLLGQGQVDSAREQAPIGGPARDRLLDHLQGPRAVVGRAQDVDGREQVGRSVVVRSGARRWRRGTPPRSPEADPPRGTTVRRATPTRAGAPAPGPPGVRRSPRRPPVIPEPAPPRRSGRGRRRQSARSRPGAARAARSPAARRGPRLTAAARRPRRVPAPPARGAPAR